MWFDKFNYVTMSDFGAYNRGLNARLDRDFASSSIVNQHSGLITYARHDMSTHVLSRARPGAAGSQRAAVSAPAPLSLTRSHPR